jgi:branched-chain amino acid transport system permease protein
MTLWIILTINSIALAGLLFLLSAGFSLIFGLMRIPNLTHGALFMLGAYFGVTFLRLGFSFWIAAILSAIVLGIIGALIERLLLRRLAGQELAQVLVTLGLAFIIADVCLLVWTGDPIPLTTPESLRGVFRAGTVVFPKYRLAVVVMAVVVAAVMWYLLERTRLGATIRAGVDDPEIARVIGIRVSRLFTAVFSFGSALAGFGGVLSGPILSVYPGLDAEMLPLALIIVILGGAGSLPGALLGSLVIGFIYNFGQAMFPELAYVILFLPMVIVLVVRPQGLFGRQSL